MVCQTQRPERPCRSALRSRSIDAAHPIDRDFLDQKLVDLIVGWCFDILHFNVLRQHPGLLRVATILSLRGNASGFLSRLRRARPQLGKRRRPFSRSIRTTRPGDAPPGAVRTFARPRDDRPGPGPGPHGRKSAPAPTAHGNGPTPSSAGGNPAHRWGTERRSRCWPGDSYPPASSFPDPVPPPFGQRMSRWWFPSGTAQSSSNGS